MPIREYRDEDFEFIWIFMKEILRAGETYALDLNMDKEAAKDLWIHQTQKVFVYEENNEILGTYYLSRNRTGGGGHVSNCGYMVSANSRGKGIASKLCLHSQQLAVDLGYKAMQFNFVVSTNSGAVHLWKKLGFEIAGTLPKAFNHPTHGYVDAFIMYKWLHTQS